jgi:hypothetical protein
LTNDIEWVEIPDEEGVIHLYHPETGEYAGPKSKWLNPDIQGEDDALAVLRAIAETRSRATAIKARYDLLLRQQERELKRTTSKEQWLMTTYENQLGRYAESALPRKADGTYRIKTLSLPWGDIAVRDSKAKLSVDSEEAAVFWAREHCPGAVKVKESVLVSLIPEAVKQEMLDEPGLAILHGLSVTPAETKYVIKTVD